MSEDDRKSPQDNTPNQSTDKSTRDGLEKTNLYSPNGEGAGEGKLAEKNSSEGQVAPAAAYERYEDSSSESSDPWTQGPMVNQGKRSGEGGSGSGSGGNGGGGGHFNGAPQSDNWEKDVLNRLAFATLNEQRRSRRWGVFFKFLAFLYVGIVLFYIPADFSQPGLAGAKHTAIIDIDGPIAADTVASADNIVGGLRAAFKNKNTAGVIIRINSPGGSPVQAGYVYDEIKRLREKYNTIKVYAVITDICASGGYYIAAAADEIYADKASIVGSIGVLMNGFGFVEAMKKIGVERRLLTAGEHKGVLDPFSPIKKDEKIHVQSLLDGIHQQFIKIVKDGRGERLKENPELFSGLFWNGEKGVELGLVDGLGSSSYVAREIIGVEKMVDFSPRLSYLDRFADRLGVAFARVMVTTFGMQTTPLQ